MNKTKTIYFLSAIVLIIGCYALNLSYSLFVQTEEKEIVDSYVPTLDYYLSVSSVTISPGKKYLVKQIVDNYSDTIGSYYGLVYKSTSSNYKIQLVDTDYNESYGWIDMYSSNDIYLYIENTGSTTMTINFSLYQSYDTLSYDNFETNYLNSNFDGTSLSGYSSISADTKYTLSASTVSMPYDDQPSTLAYKIIESYVKTQVIITDDVTSLFGSYCSESECIVEVPDSSGTDTYTFKEADLSLAYNYMDVPIDGLASGIYQIADDNGTSYYYRGTSYSNYVSFAGFTWRIVRINGDGSIRLILNGTLDKVKRSGESSVAGNAVAFNSASNDNAYVGYMYGLTGLTSYSTTTRCLMLVNGTVTDKKSTYSTQSTCEAAGGIWTNSSETATHANVASSTIKQEVDSFYETYLGGTTYNYEDYLADSVFCVDKGSSGLSLPAYYEDEEYGIMYDESYYYYGWNYGTNSAYYKAVSRLYYSGYGYLEGTESSIIPEYRFYTYYDKFNYDMTTEDEPYPALTCSSYAINDYLTYPIALLTADELALAGATVGLSLDTYLNDTSYNNSYWYTMTPFGYISGADVFVSSGSTTTIDGLTANYARGVRPVINLKAGIEFASGSGTSSNPYTIK